MSRPYLLTFNSRNGVAACVGHRCSASLGVALFLGHEASEDDLLKWADTAMYLAKKAGRNTIRFHETEV